MDRRPFFDAHEFTPDGARGNPGPGGQGVVAELLPMIKLVRMDPKAILTEE